MDCATRFCDGNCRGHASPGTAPALQYFFAYIVAQLVSFSIIFPIRHNYSAFFYANWISTAISVALGFKVIHEAFLDAFRPFHTLRDLGTVLFKWAGLVMLLVAGVGQFR